MAAAKHMVCVEPFAVTIDDADVQVQDGGVSSSTADAEVVTVVGVGDRAVTSTAETLASWPTVMG